MSFGGEFEDSCESIAKKYNGFLYSSGYFKSEVNFGLCPDKSNGYKDIYILSVMDCH